MLYTTSLDGQELLSSTLSLTSNGALKFGKFSTLLHNKYGRLRTVVAASDGALWLTTSNKDGHGHPVAGRRAGAAHHPQRRRRQQPAVTAQRIVSLLPSATEIVYALGIDDDLVGVTFECDEPARARVDKAVVVGGRDTSGMSPREIDDYVRAQAAAGADLYHLHRDALAGIEPDLILTQDLCWVCALPSATVSEALDFLGCSAQVLALDPYTLDDVLDSIGAVGEHAGVPDRAADLVAELRARLAAVARRRCRSATSARRGDRVGRPAVPRRALGRRHGRRRGR